MDQEEPSTDMPPQLQRFAVWRWQRENQILLVIFLLIAGLVGYVLAVPPLQ